MMCNRKKFCDALSEGIFLLRTILIGVAPLFFFVLLGCDEEKGNTIRDEKVKINMGGRVREREREKEGKLKD